MRTEEEVRAKLREMHDTRESLAQRSPTNPYLRDLDGFIAGLIFTLGEEEAR
jgi:hypothetical protein